MTESTVAIDVDVLPKYRIGCVTQERIGAKEEFFRRCQLEPSRDQAKMLIVSKKQQLKSLFRIIAVPNLFGDNPQAILWSSVGCRVPSLQRHPSLWILCPVGDRGVCTAQWCPTICRSGGQYRQRSFAHNQNRSGCLPPPCGVVAYFW